MADYIARTCSKCGRTLKETNFYKRRDGTPVDICKPCMTMHVDNYDPDTFTWILQALDMPYIPAEWNSIRDKAYAKDPDKVNGLSVIGKYVGKMRLSQWNKYHWADTERLILDQQEKEAEVEKERENRKEELRQALERGDISQEEFDTYMASEIIQEEKQNAAAELVRRDPVTGKVLSAEEGAAKTQEDKLMASLTKNEKIMLTTKWGKLYSAEEWLALEKNYTEMTKSFDIQDQDTKNTLILLCKANLKMNQAIDQGDYDGAAKFSRMYDSLRKSANFMAVQNKEDKSDAFDSVGEIVAYCEKNGGAIPRWEIDTPLDVIDKDIADMKKYTESLIKQDTSLAQQIENYIQQRKRMDEFKLKKLMIDTNSDLTPDDYLEFLEQQEKLKEQDEKILTGDEGDESL